MNLPSELQSPSIFARCSNNFCFLSGPRAHIGAWVACTCHGFAVYSNLYQFLDSYWVQALQLVGYSPAWVCFLLPQGHVKVIFLGRNHRDDAAFFSVPPRGCILLCPITVNDNLAHLILLVSARFLFCNVTISPFITDQYFVGTSLEIMPSSLPFLHQISIQHV